ncbi:MFS transporter [Streptomyces sp. CBMA123]|uniref:MFS transporter n=1 Tax=Streptomyces sp. CBMA123 TaxID=1896313 RepID=UPI001D5AC775|nr:MFS transporter [Streptomyces sp. CBMA123]MBD0690984.1 MFS transporter [Streptomyces sp. CBMA123]
MDRQTDRHPRRWLILVVLCLSSLVLVIDNMVLTVSIPPIAEDLKAGAQDIQWIIDSYILVFAGLLLTSGSLSDRFGRRKVMIIGLALFGAASLVAAVASSPGELIAGRVLMGVGGALVMPSTLSILITVFDDEERPKAIAAWSAVAMIGLVGGPVLGGALIAHFWWGAVFLLNVPVAAVAIVAAVVLMPESKGPWRKPDLPGMLLSMVGMTALVWSIIVLPRDGFAHVNTLGAMALAVAALTGFGIRQVRTDSPMVPLKLFRNRVFTGASFSLVLLTFATGGLMLVLTQYLQFVLEFSPTDTGLAFIPLAIASLAFNVIGAALGKKLPARVLTSVGMVIIAGGFGLLATLSVGDGFGKVALAMLVLGIGSGLGMPAAANALMGAIPGEHAGVGSALNDTIQQSGAALGVAILGTVLSSTYTGAMPTDAPAPARHAITDALALSAGNGALARAAREAFNTATSTTFTVGGIAVLVAAVLTLVLMRGTPAAEAGAEPVEAAAEPVEPAVEAVV